MKKSRNSHLLEDLWEITKAALGSIIFLAFIGFLCVSAQEKERTAKIERMMQESRIDAIKDTLETIEYNTRR